MAEKRSPLEFIASLVCRFPWTVLIVSFLIAVASVVFTVEKIEFITARSELLSPKNPFYQIYKDYRAEFGDDEVVVVVEGDDLDRARELANRLGERFEKEDFIQEVFYRIPPEIFQGNALLYLSVEELEDLREKLERHQDFLTEVTATPDLATLLNAINTEINKALVRTAVIGLLGETKAQKKGKIHPGDLEILSAVMESATLAIEKKGGYRSPWNALFKTGGTISEDGYIVKEDAGMLLILAVIRETTGGFITEKEAIARIRHPIEEVRKDFPDLRIGVTGSPALGADEMVASFRDMTIATLIALVGIVLLFVFSFRSFWRPIFPIVALLMGLFWSVGFVTLAIGHLTVLSMAFGSILAGLGIDFGIHWVVRYDENRERGIAFEPAIRQVSVQVGRANFSSAITTALAFYALGVASFRGIAELGVIAGTGVLLCLWASLTVLPAMVFLLEKGRARRTKAREVTRISHVPYLNPLLEYLFHHPKIIVGVALGITLGVPIFGFQVHYDSNLLNLQARGTESVEWEQRLIDSGGWSSLFGTDQASTLEELAAKVARYEGLSSVGSVRSVLSFVPKEQEVKKERIGMLGPFIEPFTVQQEAAFEPDPQEIEAIVDRIRFKIREEEEHPEQEAPDTVAGARKRLDRFLGSIQKIDPQQSEEALVGFQGRLFSDFEKKLKLLRDNLHPIGMTLEQVPSLIRDRYIGDTGKYLIQIFPEEDIWEPGPRKVFVQELRGVNPSVAGSALQLYESSTAMRQAYLQGGVYSFIAVFLVLLWDFRSLRWASLVMGSLLASMFWTLLGMGIFDIRFNLANLIIVPLILGVGIDYSIHAVHRSLEEGGGPINLMEKSTGKAILLSALTTIIGFGALMIAHHRGVASLGALLTLGVGSALLIAILVLPAVLQLLHKKDS
ncbi:MAG: MMPL family transporter [Deltaproteobacteria bacterium]|nr:MMPL family transporter [Deltaproteobacteria bacterium]